MAAAVSIWLRTEEEGDDSEWQTDRQSAEEESKKNVKLADRTARSRGRQVGFGIDTAKHHCTENGNITSVQDEQHSHCVPLLIRPKLALFASHGEKAFNVIPYLEAKESGGGSQKEGMTFVSIWGGRRTH